MYQWVANWSACDNLWAFENYYVNLENLISV